MAVVNAYATVADLRDELGDSGSKLDADLLEKAINAASRAVDRYCRRRFWQDATATARVYQPLTPVLAYVDDIASDDGLTVASDDAGDGTYSTTWPAGDYELQPRNVDVVASGDTGTPYAWWRLAATGTRALPVHPLRPTLQITARFGWSAVPDDVREATVLKAVGLFKRKDAPFGIAGFSEFGAVRITRQDPDVMTLLQEYRLIADVA